METQNFKYEFPIKRYSSVSKSSGARVAYVLDVHQKITEIANLEVEKE